MTCNRIPEFNLHDSGARGIKILNFIKDMNIDSIHHINASGKSLKNEIKLHINNKVNI